MITPDEFYDAYQFLYDHPSFAYKGLFAGDSGFQEALYMMVVKVDPKTMHIESDDSRNTRVQVWLEIGPWESDHDNVKSQTGVGSHDWNLDCGADTFEEAIVKLAALVKKHYGPGISSTAAYNRSEGQS